MKDLQDNTDRPEYKSPDGKNTAEVLAEIEDALAFARVRAANSLQFPPDRKI